MASGANSPEPGPEIPPRDRVAAAGGWAASDPDAGLPAAQAAATEANAEAEIVVGRIARPFGRRGEVVVEPLTDDPARFFELASAEVGPPGCRGARRGLDSVRLHKGRPLLRFEGVSDIGSAEALRGHEIRISGGERNRLPHGRYYTDELVGCRAEDEAGGVLGEIVDTLDTAGPCLLVLRRPDGSEDLIPFVEALCVAVEPPSGGDPGGDAAVETAGRVVLDLPEGLLGLNARTTESPRSGAAESGERRFGSGDGHAG